MQKIRILLNSKKQIKDFALQKKVLVKVEYFKFTTMHTR